MNDNFVISVQGPTASGKTSLAIQIGKGFRTEIISADSRQFYQEMDIGTARPTLSELEEVKHHFVAFTSIHQPINASDFEKLAMEKLTDLFKEKKAVVVAGGSGLYIDALIKGFNSIPDVDMAVRARITETFEHQGIDPLLKQLKQLDPVIYDRIDKKNFRRVLRALEVSVSTGVAYSTYLSDSKKSKRDFKVIQIAFCYEMEDLYERINQRCDQMIENGLLQEVKALYPYKMLSPLQTIGYQEFFDYFEGKMSLDMAIEKFKQHSRNYAKKQMTWLRRDRGINWFEPGGTNKILDFLEERIKS